MANMLTIASISLETGVSKEVLRKWEERYGFPVPERDASSHRTYAQHQVLRLKLIKRLIDRGMRPSQVVPLDEEGLQSLLLAHEEAPVSAEVDTGVMAELMALLRCRDRSALTQRLKQEVGLLGLEKFVLEVMCALNVAVGQAWERGEIGIRDEHVYTEVIQNLIREELSAVSKPDGLPRILVTTPSGELHTMGLLMAEALTSLHGACCISLGAQTPLEEIPHAIRDYRADIVCLSFSAAFPRRRIPPYLKSLRAAVPQAVEIWVGGAGVAGLDRSPRGIKLMATLDQLGATLHKYRLAHQVALSRVAV
ncbi:MerR family transcriptional regulator [Pseudoduganella aquatica]|uniref:MerR family transcriptional regulator n=1 Tax=Pseudoduganella aquatica TaxID=2660641 RepID=UPI001E49856E|nr:MerR family transcriptional regulator [Pseudoduganella aquatica]